VLPVSNDVGGREISFKAWYEISQDDSAFLQNTLIFNWR
jgi:hypothetical protein